MSEVYLSVIIPAYNEEKRLPRTLQEIGDYLSRRTYDYEILVVDNGSTDKTPEIVNDLKNKIRGLSLVKGESGLGKGFAVKRGMLEARGRLRLFTDADNSTSIDQFEKMRPYFDDGYDVVIGSRDVRGAVLDPPQPFLRKFILGKGFRLFRKLVIGLWDIQDTQCGFKCFSQEAALDIFPKITIMGFSFDAEALVLAKKLGYKIKEVPVYWKNDLESKVKFGHIIKMAADLLRIKFRHG